MLANVEMSIASSSETFVSSGVFLPELLGFDGAPLETGGGGRSTIIAATVDGPAAADSVGSAAEDTLTSGVGWKVTRLEMVVDDFDEAVSRSVILES